jgi:hypothetical protein
MMRRKPAVAMRMKIPGSGTRCEALTLATLGTGGAIAGDNDAAPLSPAHAEGIAEPRQSATTKTRKGYFKAGREKADREEITRFF